MKAIFRAELLLQMGKPREQVGVGKRNWRLLFLEGRNIKRKAIT